MTRKRPSKDRPDADFRNRPFKTLKGFAPPSRAAGAAPVRPTPEELPEDGDELFRRAVSGSRLIADQEDDGPAAARTPGPARPEADGGEPDQQLFLSAMSSIGTAAFGEARQEPDEEDETPRSASGRMRRLRKGSLRIAQELDLHGFTREEAVRRLEHFIASAAAQGHDAVLVITGKGLNSADGPVLPTAVAEWLRGPGARLIAEFHPAPRDRGGSGAFVVFPRRR